MPAARRSERRDDGLERQLAGVMRMCMVDDERERAQLLRAGARGYPPRRIRAERHFAPPDQRQLMARFASRDAERNAVAAAAEVQSQHQPRLVDRAASGARAQAEAAVKAVNAGEPAFDIMKQRVPDQ